MKKLTRNPITTCEVDTVEKDMLFIESQKQFEEFETRDNFGHNHHIRGDMRDDDSKLVSPNTSKDLRGLPRFSRSKNLQFKRSALANKYLTKQFKRIGKHISNLEITRAFAVWSIMFQRSDAYLIYHLNKTLRGGYGKFSTATVKKILSGVRKNNRKLDTFALYKRVYIEKSTPGRFRPLGVPEREGRVTLSMITQLLTLILEDKLPDGQHGFRRNKSCVTAGLHLIDKASVPGTYMYEFDLKACFNQISVRTTLHILEKRFLLPRLFILYLNHLLSSTPDMEERKDDDQEIVIGLDSNGDSNDYSSHIFQKMGLPQGGSLSPILAVTTLHHAISKWNVVMYADDGIIFSDTPMENGPSESEKNRLRGFGIEFAMEKSRPIDGRFQFLGIEGDSRRRECYFGPNTVSWDDPRFESHLKNYYLGKIGYNQGSPPPKGEGEVSDWSGLAQSLPYRSEEHTENYQSFLNGDKGVVRCGYARYVRYAEMSSRACDDLLENLESYSKKGRWNIVKGSQKFDYTPVDAYNTELLLGRYGKPRIHFGVSHPNPLNYQILDDIRRKQTRDAARLGKPIETAEERSMFMSFAEGREYHFNGKFDES